MFPVETKEFRQPVIPFTGNVLLILRALYYLTTSHFSAHLRLVSTHFPHTIVMFCAHVVRYTEAFNEHREFRVCYVLSSFRSLRTLAPQLSGAKSTAELSLQPATQLMSLSAFGGMVGFSFRIPCLCCAFESVNCMYVSSSKFEGLFVSYACYVCS